MDTLIASVIVFGLLVFFHELGHFLVAKLVGVKVHEFSLGFGPKLVALPRGETSYNLRAFPLGGFVRMAGMDPAEENYADEERGFNKKTVGQRIGVIFAGPLMNFVLAVFLLAVIFMTYGAPDKPTNRVQDLLPGKPADLAGIRPGDVIVEIDGNRVETWSQLSKTVGANPGRELNITVERGKERLTFKVVPYQDEKGLGKIGIHPAPKKVDPLTALASGIRYTGLMSYQILEYLGRGIARQVPLELGGPVRIVATINEAVQSTSWFINLVSLSAFLSVSLGLFNLFPIPALDGSRILFLLLEKIRGRPVEPQRENFIHMVGFGLLILLIVVITYHDILQLIM
ncbi:MAG: RIP metalloprotease RseP [Peptococcaceae bacterium]|nr:RIP metalloprotease RseP [Peptococcaceae bacterium]